MKRPANNVVAMPLGSMEPEIEWPDYPRIEPSEYTVYCKAARWYFDPQYRRWVCILRFDVLTPDLLHTIACIPLWLNGGDGERPKAGRRSKFFLEWVRAAGSAPARGVRPTLDVFRHRIARVLVRDTKGPAPYSVIEQICSWETGGSAPSHLVNLSHSQERPVSKTVESVRSGEET